jgi:hypothetical protein
MVLALVRGAVLGQVLIELRRHHPVQQLVRQAPQAPHRHMAECYNEDFSALLVEVNTEAAQISLYSRKRPVGLHHFAKYDLHKPEIRKGFFQLISFDNEVGLQVESGPQVPLISMRNGRFRILGM